MKTFYSLGNKNNHENDIHKKIKNFKCNFCKKPFSKAVNLKKHQEAIHEGIRHKCRYCEASYTETGTLQKHIKHVHEETAIRHKCEKCERTFENQSSLKFHSTSVHDKIKNYICDFCNLPLASKTNLTIHMKRKHK